MNDGGDCRTAPATPGLLISARERESGQVTEIFSNIVINSYNGDISIVQCSMG